MKETMGRGGSGDRGTVCAYCAEPRHLAGRGSTSGFGWEAWLWLQRRARRSRWRLGVYGGAAVQGRISGWPPLRERRLR